MPHKKNPIDTEKVAGMAREARKCAAAIKENIASWEGRDISQSSVERISWPDLFHVAVHALETITKVVDGLVIYQDNMLREIVASRGTYATTKAKGLLADWLAPHGIGADTAYRIVQAASSEVFGYGRIPMANRHPKSLLDTDELLIIIRSSCALPENMTSIADIIQCGIEPNPSLGVDAKTAKRWNRKLKLVFAKKENQAAWKEIFKPSYWLRNEARQFKNILGK